MSLQKETQQQGDIVLDSDRHVVLADLAFHLDESGLRYLSWQGVEVVRAISAPLRDEKWGSLTPQYVQDKFDTGSKTATLTRVSRYLDGRLETKLTIVASAQGTITAIIEASASEDIQVNRAGFTVLHPIDGVAGQPVKLLQKGGNEATKGYFPGLIKPSQPFTDIVEMEHNVFGVQVSIAFKGDVFETEDQRNWSDASFKTYCRPLSLPFPYTIKKGDTLRQEIHITLSGPIKKTSPDPRPAGKDFQSPDILLAVETDWHDRQKIEATGGLLRLNPGDSTAQISDVGQALSGGIEYVDVEFVISDKDDPEKALFRQKQLLDAAGIAPRHIIALPEAYLKSYQPAGPWPTGVTLEECADAAAKVFPNSAVGIGMLTHFTELNRYRPRSDLGDYVTHGNSAIVHAADDLSVLETLLALPDIFKTARSIAQGRGYRLGLMSIGMRSNPYGKGLQANPHAKRVTMTDRDPRQSQMFAAAYAIAVASLAASAGIEALALAAPHGPFGVRNKDGSLRPIYHAVRGLSALAGQKMSLISSLGPGVVGIGSNNAMVLANCNPSPATFKAPVRSARILDEAQVKDASKDTDWMYASGKTLPTEITLAPFACLFAGLGEVS